MADVLDALEDEGRLGFEVDGAGPRRPAADEALWQEYLVQQRRMLGGIFPTPTFACFGASVLLCTARVKPKSALGWAGTLFSSGLLVVLWRTLELANYILAQELRQAQETTRQRVRFHRAVIDALNACADGEPVSLCPKELQPVDGRPGLFRYQARSCTPLWFRRPPGSGEESNDWEWSPDLSVWIDLETMRVPAGIWEGQKPAKSNQVFLSRLRALRDIGGQIGTTGSMGPPPLQLPAGMCSEDLPEPPAEFLCPISHDVMTDPVVSPSGVTYDRPYISSWLEHHSHEPATNRHLRRGSLYPNLTLRQQIESWLAGISAKQRNGDEDDTWENVKPAGL